MGKKKTFLGIAAAAALLLLPVGTQAASLVPPLVEGGAQVADFSLFPFWHRLLTDMGTQPVIAVPAALDQAETAIPTPAVLTQNPAALPLAAACADQRHCTPQEWTAFLDTLKGGAARDQIEAVNRWANAKPYVEDIANWFIPDYWATPGEFMARGGDCEDFAAIKYFSLVRLGFAPEAMKIMVVSDTRENSFHAVLTVTAEGKTWVLDNFLPDVTLIESLPFYQPIYSLNERGWWMHSAPIIQLAGATIAANPMSFQRR